MSADAPKPDRPSEPGPPPTGLPRAGGRLGRYELLAVLGHGAMASVFRARDPRLGRDVAIKVMNLVMSTRGDAAERFRREAQAVAALKHPGIVEIFDFVAATGEEPAYIVSELIDGPTLRQFLDERRGRLLPEAATLLALPLAQALGAAHARGIVHRDLKPDNVMIERGAAGCRVVLTDFGVAHVTGLETMTATGALVGSPAYMSPEQARGKEVEPASDLWALGVLLYQMSTGHPPFSGKDPLTVLAAVTRGHFKPLSQVSPYAGSDLDRIVGRCLKMAPAERYPDAAALAQDLGALCRSVGLEDQNRCLRHLLGDPDAFEADLRPRVAAAAVASTRRHARRGELARALGELSRATAYVPGHGEAARLLRRITRQRRWLKIGGAIAACAALVGLLAAGAPWLTKRQEEQTGARGPEAAARDERGPLAPIKSQSSPSEPEQPASTPFVRAQPAAGPAVPVADPEERAPAPSRSRPISPASASTTKTSPPARPDRRSPVRTRLGGPPAEAEPRAGADQGNSATAAEPAPDPSTIDNTPLASPPVPEGAGPPARPAARPRLVQVELFVQRGYCNPSLGERPAAAIPPTTYNDIAPGEHVLFCTFRDGRKQLVGKVRIDPLPPDHVRYVQVAVDSQNRLSIGRQWSEKAP
jgi:eukaryotic-like serine/threonine-protein kinase